MDLTNTTTKTNTANNTKIGEYQAPPPTLPSQTQLKSLFFTNGSVNHHIHSTPPPPVTAFVSYKECLKNHAASIGGYAVDGCGEFMPSPTSSPTDPTSLKCAACGCHRNFHRVEHQRATATTNHFTQRPRRFSSSPSTSPSPSPSPPRQMVLPSFYSSGANMLMALRTAVSVPLDSNISNNNNPQHVDNQVVEGKSGDDQKNSSKRKRFRTKFSQEQKGKMHGFAERLGWKMQKSDERLVEEFCSEVGVSKSVLKVWMHNNKNTFGKKDITDCKDFNGDINHNPQISAEKI